MPTREQLTAEQLKSRRIRLAVRLVLAAGFVACTALFIVKYLGNVDAGTPGMASSLGFAVVLPLAVYIAAAALILSFVNKRFVWRAAAERRVIATVIDKYKVDAPIQRQGFALMVGYSQKFIAVGGFIYVFRIGEDETVTLMVDSETYERYSKGSHGMLVYKTLGRDLSFVSFEETE